MGDIVAEVRSRLRDQARMHWIEFGVIVASANVLLSLVLLGRVLGSHRWWLASVVATGIAIASILSAMLAYYSIQVGALLIFGPLRFRHVALAFGVTATQLALFLWPAHTLALKAASEKLLLEGLRQWLLFYALFAFTAVAAILHADMLRKRAPHCATFAAYERAQRRDKWSATGSGVVALACWALTFWTLTLPLVFGVAWAIAASGGGMASQSYAAKGLYYEVGG